MVTYAYRIDSDIQSLRFINCTVYKMRHDIVVTLVNKLAS